VLEVFYDIPRVKYEWVNFKKQALKKDKGEELKSRINAQKPKDMGEGQI